jgi:RNA polymerase sigma factor (sigma-70 family)
MPDVKDMDLVREYADRNSEPAFAELVHRHINLVYSVALRFGGNPADAQEVAQAVFIILAQKAASLRAGTILTGWLYETTRFTAMNLLRTKARQHAREQEAYMQSTLNDANPDSAWQQLAPLLEEAMSRLNEKERALLALRFFENKSGAETAASAGMQEWAARKRVERAVEKLRNFFTKRGVVLSSKAVTDSISANSVQAAPVALAKAITAMALTKGAAAGGSTLTLIKGAVKLMAWTKTKIAVVTGVAILLTAGLATVAVKTMHALRTQPKIQGDWEGVLKTSLGAKLRVVLHLSAANGSYRATLDSIDQRSKDIPINKIVYDYPSLEFESKALTGTYRGKLNSTVDTISGNWKQPLLDTTLTMKRTATPSTIPESLAESDYTPRIGSDLQDYWKGTLQAGSTALRVAFKISEPTDGKFIAELDCPDQGITGAVVSSVTYDKPTIQMEVGVAGGVFEGKASKDGTEITGTWTQAGIPLPLTIKRSDPTAERAEAAARDANKDYSHSDPNELTGHWKGALDVQGTKLHLALHVAKLPNGDLSATMDSLDQGANDIPANTVRFTAPNAHLEWPAIGSTYDGTLQNGKISGKWKQGGQTFPLVFARSAQN